MSLVNTRIQNIRAKSNLDKNELRPSRYGAVDLFITQSDSPNGILTPELKKKALESVGSTIETPVIKYDADISIGSERTLTIADSENTSEMYQFTFVTYAWGFTIIPSLFHNNEIDVQRDFEVKFNKYLYKLAETLDKAAIAQLATSKTQVFGDKLIYNTTGNLVTADWDSRVNIIGDINPLMEANDFYRQIHVLGNMGVNSLIRKLAEHGLYNDENKQLEYQDKILHWTNRLTNDGEAYATGYAIEDGNIGALYRLERECLLNSRTGDGHEWSTDVLPMLGIPVGTYYYDAAVDGSAIAGAASADMKRVRKEHYGFAVDVAFVTPYNSNPDTIASPIMAFEIDKAGAGA